MDDSRFTANVWRAFILLLVASATVCDKSPRPKKNNDPVRRTCLYVPLRADQKKAFRYRSNIHHQSEFVYPAIDNILFLRKYNHTLVHTLVIELKLLPWSRTMLRLVQPNLHIVTYNRSVVRPLNPVDTAMVRRHCGDWATLAVSRRVNLSCSTYFNYTSTFRTIQHAAAQRCNLDIPRVCPRKDKRPYIGILNRHVNRRIANIHKIVSGLKEHYQAKVVVRDTFDNATFCDQVAWFTGVDAMIVAHGQPETNSVFLPPGSVMIEVVPWVLADYCTYRSAMENSMVNITQVVAERLPGEEYAALKGGDYNMTECLFNKTCRIYHRDLDTMKITAQQIIDAIDKAGGLRKICRKKHDNG